MSSADDKKKQKLKKRVSELTKRLTKAESANSALAQELKAKNTQIAELEDEVKKRAQKARVARGDKEQGGDMEQIANGLMEENGELKEQLTYMQDAFEEKKTKYKLKIEQLENDLIDLNKYYEQPDKRLSMKRKADFIRLENEVRQKNLYIDSLLEKIKELQSNNRDSNWANYRNRLSSKNDTKNSIDVSKISANK